jgi:hypothetical protein
MYLGRRKRDGGRSYRNGQEQVGGRSTYKCLRSILIELGFTSSNKLTMLHEDNKVAVNMQQQECG